MSRSQHKLKVQKDGVTYTCEMYTTPQEARDNLYAGKHVRFNKDGVNLYVPLTQALNSATESTPLLMYKKGDNTKYCIAQKAFYRANVTAVANAVITAKAYNENNVEIASWNTGAKWFPYGTKITASGVGNPSNIWNNPTMKIDRGTNVGETMTVSNIEISAASAVTRKSYSFTLNPGSNQTVTLKYTEPGKSQVSVAVSGSSRTFTVLAGTTWTASITAVTTGYNAGSLNATIGTITGSGVSITATSAALKTFTLKLNGTTNQTVTLKYTQPGASQVTKTSAASAQSWSVKYGTTWTATVAGGAAYNAGTLSPGGSGTITANATISVTAATFKTYTLKLNATSNQTITLKYKNRNSSNTGYETEVTRTSTGSAQSYTLRHGSTWTASISAPTGWNAGTLSPGTSGTLTANTTVSATAAVHKTFNLVLAGTSNQTITLKYKNYNGSTYASEVTKTSTGSNQTFSVGYGTTWTASISPAASYTAGKLSATSGTVTANTTVSATAATKVTVVVTILQQNDGEGGRPASRQTCYDVVYTNASGNSATFTQGWTSVSTKTITIKVGTKVSISLESRKDSDGWIGNNVQLWCGSTRYIDQMGRPTWTSWAITSDTTFRIYGS